MLYVGIDFSCWFPINGQSHASFFFKKQKIYIGKDINSDYYTFLCCAAEYVSLKELILFGQKKK